jgi:excisionase family DNA binding protein
MDPTPHTAPAVPAATLAAVCRTWEAVLERKYPGTRWHVYPRETVTAPSEPAEAPSEPAEETPGMSAPDERRDPTGGLPSEPLWTIQQLADYLGVPVETVRRWRSRSPRGGPRGLRIGKHVRFDPADVQRWLAEQADEG